MNLVNRIAALERQLGDDGCFACADRLVIRDTWYDGSGADAPAETCEVCGRRIPSIEITEDENWYANRAHDLAREQIIEGSP